VTLRLPASVEIIEQAPDAIVLVDAEGAIAYANRRVVSLFGVAPADLVGQPVEALVPERHRRQHASFRGTYQSDPKVRPMGDSSRLHLRGRRADGSEFPVDIHLAPILGGDGHRWTLAVIRDATERHRVLEELRNARQLAEQVARLKGEFLAVAAHELSQPQQTLELMVNLIERQLPKGTEIAELAAQAGTSLARMRELLRVLIEISRLESGTLRVIDQPVSVAEIFGELERQFAPVAQARALRFECAPCPHVVETDPTLLRAMLSNLVANAIRYTPRGEVSVRCAVPAGGGLRLAVSDTGIGIPDDQLQKIFEDFHRLDEGRRAYQDGFGLGLGIVRRLSALLGYSITVHSAVGRGSTFAVGIPAARVYPSPEAFSGRAPTAT